MAKVIKTLRNHWKKSLFGASVLAYGVNYGVNQFEIEERMRVVCHEAVNYGDISASLDKPKRITVILNPAANKRKAKKNFENYCAPLLHLAGIFVTVIETEKEGHGRDIVSKLDPKTDAIIVAGGDGTLSEVVTGLMRDKGELCRIPIGVIPLGKTNTLAKQMYGSDITYLGMVKAALTVIKGKTKPIDAIRIEVLQEDEESPKPPVYGISGIQWGLWREIKKREDAFWYMGPLSKYAPLIFHGNALDKEVTANIRYTKPCSGCSQCYMQRPDLLPEQPAAGPSRWWNVISLKNRRLQNQGIPAVDYKSIINDECSVVEELSVKSSDLSVITSNDPDNKIENKTTPHLELALAPKIKYQGELLFNGVKAVKEGKPVSTKIEAKQLEIRPVNRSSEATEENLSIDNEEYDIRPIRVTVLPNSVKIYCP